MKMWMPFFSSIEEAKRDAQSNVMCYQTRCKIIKNFKLKLITDQKTIACESGSFISHKWFSSAHQFQPFTNWKWPNTATGNRSQYERATSKIMKMLNDFERDLNGNLIIKYGMRETKKKRINLCRLAQDSFLFRCFFQNDHSFGSYGIFFDSFFPTCIGSHDSKRNN